MKVLSIPAFLLALLVSLQICTDSAHASSFDILTDVELHIALGSQKNAEVSGSSPKRPKIYARLGGRLVATFREWQAVQYNAETIHFKRLDWADLYLSLNTKEKRLYLVGGGNLGEEGGIESPIGLRDIKRTSDGDYVVRLLPVVLSYQPDSNSTSLTFQMIPLASANKFSAEKINEHTVQIKHRLWRDDVWEADTKSQQVWLLPGRSKGERTLVQGAVPILNDFSYPETTATTAPAYPAATPLPYPSYPAVSGVTQQSDAVKTGPQPRWPVDLGMGTESQKSRQPSAWQEKKQDIYQPLLAKQKSATLLVPVQVDGYAIDRIGRSLMTRFIHQRLVDAGGSLPNPTLVARALGENKRIFNRQKLYALAKQIGAEKIILPMVGHHRQGQLNLTLLRLNAGTDGSFNEHSEFSQVAETALSFSDELLPFEVLLTHLDTLLQGIKVELPMPEKGAVEEASVIPELPAGPLELAEKVDLSVLENAYFLQLLGLLHPKQTVASEGLFERSLLAAWSLPETHPERRLLISRALFQLERRPAAIKFLGPPRSVAEKSLLAFLHGNLPLMKELRPQFDSPLKKLLADIEYKDLLWAYTRRPLEESTLEEMIGENQAWAPLIARRLLNNWIWRLQPNISIKDQLDQAFPIAGFTAESLVSSRIALGQSPYQGPELDLVAYEHYRQVLDTQGAQLFAAQDSSRLRKSDYLDLLYQTSEANLIDSVAKSVLLQHLTDQGLQKLRDYAAVYEGHPYLTFLKSRALKKKAASSRGAERQQLEKEVANLLDLSAFWEQGQSERGNLQIFKYDFPKRYMWLNRPDWSASVENSLLYTNSSFRIARLLYNQYKHPGQEKHLEALIAKLENRFVGHPDRQNLLAEISEKNGEVEQAERYYRDAIDLLPDEWDAYRGLAGLYIRQDRLQEAYELLLSYPPFAAENQPDTVSLTGQAYKAAKLFYDLGDTEKAAGLYRLANGYQTGSEAGMTSAALLGLIGNDYPVVGANYLRAVRRYQSSSAYANYLRYLHATGQHQDAWAIFENLAPGKLSAKVWGAALYGLRMEGKSEQEIAAWFALWKEKPESAEFVMQRLVDRSTRPDQGLLIEGENQVKKLFIDIYSGFKENRFKPEFPYSIIKEGQQIIASFLPYLAVHYSKLGRDKDFRARLQEFILARGRGFDTHLAEAVLAGLENNSAAAIASFRKAWLQVPTLKDALLPPLYQLAELCEWFYLRTGEQAYLTAALNYAQLQSNKDPLVAWPYSFRAKFLQTEPERLSALGMALFLDQHAERIAHFSAEDNDRARAMIEEINIFQKAPKELQKTQI